MSLDIDIDGEEFNITYNYSYIYYGALVPLRELDGKLADDCFQKLVTLQVYIEDNYEALLDEEWEHCKGWGTVALFHEKVCAMRLACVKYPDAVVGVV